MKTNLFDYLTDSADAESHKFLEILKYSLRGKIHYYGDHFNYSRQSKLFFYLKNLAFLVLIFLTNLLKKKEVKKTLGISLSYFHFDEWFSNDTISIHRIFSNPRLNGQQHFFSIKLYFHYLKILFAINFRDFNYLVSKDFFKIISEYMCLLEDSISKNNYEFILLPNDTDFHSRILITIFKKLGKKTFLIAHGGMPQFYDQLLDNGTDHVLMWGRKTCESYVSNGYHKDKFSVSGHPFYNKKPQKLLFNFDNILVLTKSVNGVVPTDEIFIEDRGNSIMYLKSIQKVLLGLGVKKARLRPHPSENYLWYSKFIDMNFFKLDREEVKASLRKATLVIGPVSTMFIDTLYSEVNYLVYEPIINGRNLFGHPITAPMDGSDARIPIARDEKELRDILINKIKVDLDVYEDFSASLDCGILAQLLKK